MEDLVAVEVALEGSLSAWLMAWGRVIEPVDPQYLAAAALRYWAANRAPSVGARVCGSLGEAAHVKYFFEALFAFSERGRPEGDAWYEWRRERLTEQLAGEGFWLMGQAPRSSGYLADATSDAPLEEISFSHDAPLPVPTAATWHEQRLWAVDELRCHSWAWSGDSWVPVGADPPTPEPCRSRGSHNPGGLGDGGSVCVDCGLVLASGRSGEVDV